MSRVAKARPHSARCFESVQVAPNRPFQYWIPSQNVHWSPSGLPRPDFLNLARWLQTEHFHFQFIWNLRFRFQGWGSLIMSSIAQWYLLPITKISNSMCVRDFLNLARWLLTGHLNFQFIWKWRFRFQGWGSQIMPSIAQCYLLPIAKISNSMRWRCFEKPTIREKLDRGLCGF